MWAMPRPLQPIIPKRIFSFAPLAARKEAVPAHEARPAVKIELCLRKRRRVMELFTGQTKTQIPILESVLLMALTIWARRGWDSSNPSTEELKPCKESFSRCGFCCARVASWAERSVNPAMLSACSPWVLDNWATSAFKVPSNCNNSRRRSSFIESALCTLASIFPIVSSIIASNLKDNGGRPFGKENPEWTKNPTLRDHFAKGEVQQSFRLPI